MFKKLFTAIALATLLACSGVNQSSVVEPNPTPVVILQTGSKIVDYIQERTKDTVKIVDFREDSVSVWLWIDNFDMPKSCDYVIVLEKLGGLDPDTGLEYLRTVDLINKRTAAPADPCEVGYKKYDKYMDYRKQHGA
jgi:hypothetical protein